MSSITKKAQRSSRPGSDTRRVKYPIGTWKAYGGHGAGDMSKATGIAVVGTGKPVN